MWKTSGIILFTLILSFINLSVSDIIDTRLYAQTKINPPFYLSDTVWIDSVFNSLTTDERIAQLLMVPAYSNKNTAHADYIEKLISVYKIGGLIFMQGGPVRQVDLINRYQSVSKVPLLISMDAEWSLSMRLDSCVLYPRQMLLGAITDEQLIYDMGAEFARQLKRVGVQVSFSPVVDVNNNPANPVINDRSFGEDKNNVCIKSYNYMKGLQDNRVLATAKHFPGHGDTDVDSHKSLPVIYHDRNRLDSLELYPFRYLIDKGISSVMVSHLFVPKIDSTPNLPTSLSPKAVTQLLKHELGFKGLVITDALNMGGITTYYKQGEYDVLALLAGNDILLFPSDVELVISKIKEAVENGLISQEEIDMRCRKILRAKYWAGLSEFKQISTENIYDDLNNPQARIMQQKLIENALTLVKNTNQILPLKSLDTLNIATIVFGTNEISSFQNRMQYYAKTDNYIFNNDLIKFGEKRLIEKLKEYDVVIAGVHGTGRSPSNNFKIQENTVNFIDKLALETNLILDVFANPYSLAFFKNSSAMSAIIVSYNDWEITNDLSAQLIFGGIPAKGRLPVSAGSNFVSGDGYDTEKIRLKYTQIPEDAGADSQILLRIDSIIDASLVAGAFPGGQVAAARNGIVFYQRSFGYHTDDKKIKVSDMDIYDLASVTKVSGALPAIMKLYGDGVFTLDDKLSQHLPIINNTNKKDMIIRDILTHRAGLKSWVPFYKNTIRDTIIRSEIYSIAYNDTFAIPVAAGMYMNRTFVDSIYQQICISDLNPYGKYVYSDLGFYLFASMIETKTKQTLPNYLDSTFYSKLGAWTTGYLPLRRFSANQIVPTENDMLFRNQLLHGYVHDQGAAMLGGVSGHAGLFSNANDLLKIMQMYLDGGEYGGEKFLKKEVIDEFTKYQFNPISNRRGLGFDKKNPGDTSKGIGSESASDLAYGHGGYTGTMVWADPKYNFAFVFNSNRVCPSAENWKIITLNIRTDIEEAFYQSFISFDAKEKAKKTVNPK
ncbi:MAG: glycoside hydrolase family 3 N-terminal domain-containing protein [Bacteroidales bacterium]|nr:glycoside hydrolase family 3 N-terminal domain-containing protein [Bacteroidales bacterium]